MVDMLKQKYMDKGETHLLLEGKTDIENFRDVAMRIDFLHNKIDDIEKGERYCVCLPSSLILLSVTTLRTSKTKVTTYTRSFLTTNAALVVGATNPSSVQRAVERMTQLV